MHRREKKVVSVSLVTYIFEGDVISKTDGKRHYLKEKRHKYMNLNEWKKEFIVRDLEIVEVNFCGKEVVPYSIPIDIFKSLCNEYVNEERIWRENIV